MLEVVLVYSLLISSELGRHKIHSIPSMQVKQSRITCISSTSTTVVKWGVIHCIISNIASFVASVFISLQSVFVIN